ncbi:MAG TPA: RNA 2',3'-cyclic phosphodiesterase [Pyrinomonadaceae bacterium]|nr:RNA 2',3'-cyclic phosphodiesterase [Pyrinomonadaceae bacterium]
MKIRTFISVDINAESRRKVADYIQKLKNDFKDVRVNWDKPEKLHLTLKFLGDADEIQLAEVQKIVAEIAEKQTKFTLSLSENGVFPHPRNAKVLWIGVEDKGGNLTKINESLEKECKPVGFESEQRNYHPHLTIARIKDACNSAELVKKHLETQIEPREFEVSEIVIYESKLQPSGSIYKKIFNAKLKNKENLPAK